MEALTGLIQQVERESLQHPLSPPVLIACLDLTQLGSNDNEESIQRLSEKAYLHQVAAVCVQPPLVACAKKTLQRLFNNSSLQGLASAVQVATVINFPAGTHAIKDVLVAITYALEQGAEEFDIVIPYQAYLASGDIRLIKNFILSCKKLLPKQCIKVILESGDERYSDKTLIDAALASLEAGAQFLKTSTGKITHGACLHDAATLLYAIQKFGDETRGFKASGGVRTHLQAAQYYLLAQKIMGEAWPNKNTFRLGASSLLDDLIANMPS